MRIKKINGTYQDYDVQLSYGQLIAIRDSLERDHSGPESDEIYRELNYYLQNTPGPGVDPEEFKEQQKAGEEGAENEKGASDEDHLPVPPPPASDADLPHEGEEGADAEKEHGGHAPEEPDVEDLLPAPPAA